MPSDLQNSPMGVLALRRGMLDQIERRLRRWFKTHTVRTYDDWIASGKTVFEFDTVLGELNLAHDPEAIALLDLLARFESETITQDLNIYVDTVNGSDVTGDGSEDNPLGTFLSAQRIIPKYVNSKINILIRTRSGFDNVPVTQFQNMYLNFGVNAQLTVQGIDEDEIIDGPYTISVWSNIGTLDTYGHGIQVAAPSFIASELIGKFVHVLTGTEAGNYYVICENSSDTLYILQTPHVLSNGDTFEIVEPGTTFDLELQPDYTSALINIQSAPFSFNSKLAITGINFKNDSGIALNMTHCNAYIAFCNIQYFDTSGGQCHLNLRQLIYTTEIKNEYLRDIEYPNVYINNGRFSAETQIILSVMVNDFYTSGNRTLILNGGFNIITYEAGSITINDGIVWRGAGTAISGVYGGTPLQNLSILGMFVYPTLTNVIDGTWMDNAYIEDLEGNSPTGYTMIISANSKVKIDGSPLTGLTNDILWESTGLGSPWPAIIGSSVNDTNGCYCTRVS